MAGGASMAGVSPITAGVPQSTAAAGKTVQAAATGSQIIKLNVNGAEYEVQVDPEESLRDCLREKLGYLSIKDMCLGHGACETNHHPAAEGKKSNLEAEPGASQQIRDVFHHLAEVDSILH